MFSFLFIMKAEFFFGYNLKKWTWQSQTANVPKGHVTPSLSPWRSRREDSSQIPFILADAGYESPTSKFLSNYCTCKPIPVSVQIKSSQKKIYDRTMQPQGWVLASSLHYVWIHLIYSRSNFRLQQRILPAIWEKIFGFRWKIFNKVKDGRVSIAESSRILRETPLVGDFISSCV